jgi:hypothetical protein
MSVSHQLSRLSRSIFLILQLRFRQNKNCVFYKRRFRALRPSMMLLGVVWETLANTPHNIPEERISQPHESLKYRTQHFILHHNVQIAFNLFKSKTNTYTHNFRFYFKDNQIHFRFQASVAK